MSCSIHEDLEHVGICNDCGRTLCRDCVDKFNPPTCPHCVVAWGNGIRKQFFMMAGLSLILGIASVGFLLPGILQTGLDSAGVFLVLFIFLMFAGIPWGWSALNKITPQVFLFMPLGGWLIYFSIKLAISISIGLYIIPFQIWKYHKNMKLVKMAYDV